MRIFFFVSYKWKGIIELKKKAEYKIDLDVGVWQEAKKFAKIRKLLYFNQTKKKGQIIQF